MRKQLYNGEKTYDTHYEVIFLCVFLPYCKPTVSARFWMIPNHPICQVEAGKYRIRLYVSYVGHLLRTVGTIPDIRHVKK